MTIQVLTEPAIEGSTYAIVAAFTDDAGVAVVPNTGTLVWTLLKKVGVGAAAVATVVNGKLNVAATSAATVTIVLSGDDLALVVGEGNPKTRYVLFEGLFNSSLGNNLPFKHECSFTISDLVGVPE